MGKRHDNSEKRLLSLKVDHEPPAHRLTASTNRDGNDILLRLERLEKLEALTSKYPDEEGESQKNLSWVDSAKLENNKYGSETTPLMTRTTIKPQNGSQVGNGRGLTVSVITKQQHWRKIRTRCR